MSAPNKSYDPVEVAVLSPEQIEQAVAAALEAIAGAADLDQLKAVRLQHAGDKSPLSLANREIGALPPAAKAEAGKRVGQARGRVAAALAARQVELEAERAAAGAGRGVARRHRARRPRPRKARGTRCRPCRSRSPTCSSAWAGRSPRAPRSRPSGSTSTPSTSTPDHPARQMQDTFFVDPPSSGLVLRTHTSPVQIRTMLERGAPTYVICPGKVFRTDELDATHTPVFHQIEGLAVDKGLTMAHLKGTLEHWAHLMFGPDIQIRLRPSYFPFTEPSAEPDLLCFVCKGSGKDGPRACRTCGGSGWIEWGGCGMVHPNVLRASGIDPDVYTGFAFGMGVERTMMFRNGVADMRDMIEGDVRFSRHYGVGD